MPKILTVNAVSVENKVSDRLLAFLCVVPASVVGLFFVFFAAGESVSGERKFTLFDDVLISMSYARTFAETGELVWYPGAERVEGFSNPLWTMYMSFLHWVGFSGNTIMVAVALSGLVTVLATGILAFYLSKRFSNDRRVWFASGMSASLTFSLMFWALRGMEVGVITMLTTALVLVAVKLYEFPSKKLYWSVFLIVIVGFWVRIDFAIVVATVAIWSVWFSSNRLKTASVYFGSLMFAAATSSMVRFWYYGELVPNTYKLKVEGVGIGDRIARGLQTDIKLFFVFVVALAALFGFLAWGSKHSKKFSLLLFGVFSATVAYSTYVGGDAWETFPNRFVTPGLVLVGVMGISGLLLYFSSFKFFRIVSLVVVSCVVFVVTSLLGYVKLLSGEEEGLHIRQDIAIANWMESVKNVTDENASVAVTIAGAGGYYSERKVIDMLGKTDPDISSLPPVIEFYPGHDRWDYEYIIKKYRPDVIAGLWIYEPINLEMFKDNGYESFCFSPDSKRSILVLPESPNIKWSLLYSCPEKSPISGINV